MNECLKCRAHRSIKTVSQQINEPMKRLVRSTENLLCLRQKKNLPMLNMDHLPMFSAITENVRCDRIKATPILREVAASTNCQ